jgi:hypothetical protein
VYDQHACMNRASLKSLLPAEEGRMPRNAANGELVAGDGVGGTEKDKEVSAIDEMDVSKGG